MNRNKTKYVFSKVIMYPTSQINRCVFCLNKDFDDPGNIPYLKLMLAEVIVGLHMSGAHQLLDDQSNRLLDRLLKVTIAGRPISFICSSLPSFRLLFHNANIPEYVLDYCPLISQSTITKFRA